MRKIPKLYFVIGGVVLVVLVAFFMLSHRPKPPQFATATATRGDVDDTVLATGALQPYQLVSVGAQVSGRVISLKVGLGDHVTKGEVIAIIDPVPAVNQLKTSQAALAQMIAQRDASAATLVQDQIALKRESITLAASASSQADYDNAEATEKAAKANLDALNAQIDQAKITVETARVNLGYTNVVAPIDGDVLDVVTKEGQTVNAVQAAPTIVILGDMSTMTAKAQISEADVIKVKPGQTVYFTVLGDAKRRFYGRMRSIAAAPESIASEVANTTSTTSTTSTTAIYYDGLVDVPNADRVLKADMTAQCTVVVAEAHDVLTIPSAALDPAMPTGAAGGPPQGAAAAPAGAGGPPPGFAHRPSGAMGGAPMGPRGADQHMVLVLDANGRPHPRMVHIGLNNNIIAEVTSGLQPGEKVVTGQVTAGAVSGFGPGRGGPPPGGPGFGG